MPIILLSLSAVTLRRSLIALSVQNIILQMQIQSSEYNSYAIDNNHSLFNYRTTITYTKVCLCMFVISLAGRIWMKLSIQINYDLELHIGYC